MDASYIDLADATHLEFDYMRWIRIVLRAQHAHRVLHIGGGACALARALASEDPSGRQEVCEIDAEVLALAREHMGLRRARGLRVRHAEGRAHIATLPAGSFDAVVIDAFVGAEVPTAVVTVQALNEVARVAPLALVNVVDSRALAQVQPIAAGLATAYPHVWALGSRVGNTIVVGGTQLPDLQRIAAQAAADPAPARVTAPTEAARWVAGTGPHSDPPPVQS